MINMVAILLSTYNSERFLKQQLDSLLRQTYTDWKLYIRDDGSSDNTLNIISHYISTDNRIVLMHDNVRRGAMSGFMWLLEQVNADYYMFCDHDDVWKNDKIAVTLRKMKEHDLLNGKPIVVHTDLEVVDGNLNCLYPSYWNFKNFCVSDFNSKYFHLAYNNITGCTMMLNQEAKRVSLPCSKMAQMHDSWIAASVLWNDGLVLSIPDSTIYYRQHGRNTIGANELPPFKKKFFRLSALIRQNRKQAQEVNALCGMSSACFWIIKIWYMCRMYILNVLHKTE